MISQILLSYRVSLARHCAHVLWLGYVEQQPKPMRAAKVKSMLKSHQIALNDGDIVVTEAGFVTMAILPECAAAIGNALVVPGVDHRGKRGYLVLTGDAAPYHSLADCEEKAHSEFVAAGLKASSLVRAFGDKGMLKRCVRNAPAGLRCTVEDFERSGLCLWGAESFLQRLGLLRFARRFGLPYWMLKYAGPYGERLVAARLLRDYGNQLELISGH